MARDQGCQIVGLGGYTSIVTGNCKRIRVDGVGLTSGNALTVGVGLTMLREAAAERGIHLAERVWRLSELPGISAPPTLE